MPYADLKSPAARESQRRAGRKHYAANRESEIARSSKWNRANRPRILENNALRRSTKAPKEKVLFNNAKQRARMRGIEFTIRVEDVVVPEFCPMLGLPLVVATGCAKDNSPSIDRINPLRGYIPGNIQIISHRANTIKSNATLDELRSLVAAWERL